MSSAIPNLSRSSLVAVVLICIIGSNLNIYKHSLILRYLYMICYALFFFYVLKTTIDTSVGEGTISTARLQNFESKVRMDALWNSIDAVLNRPFFGGQVEAYKSELYGNAAPHNCFAISAVYNGIPALIVMLLLYSVIICYIIKIIKGKFVTTNYQISFSICLGLLAYLIKGNFHNDTLARGGIMGMILLGILISSEKLGSLTQIDPGQRCGPYPESRSI
jgi:hypothetical protein